MREIAETAFKLYPRRSMLGLALFVGQAFIYNAVTFGLGTFLVEFYDIGSAQVPLYIALFAFSNFLGPLLLGKLFDTVGRKPMIAGTYLGSAAVLCVLTFLFLEGTLGLWGFMALLLVTFFLASAGASSAYLTVSEIFPMETRALAIAFFYAIGTAAGGITGPYLFGKMIETGEPSKAAIAFFIGAAVMALGGVAELVLGVKAEGKDLESIAKPLSVEEDDRPAPRTARAGPDRGGLTQLHHGEDVAGRVLEPRDRRARVARDALLVLAEVVVALEAHAARAELLHRTVDVVDLEVEDRVGRRREVRLRVDQRRPVARQMQRQQAVVLRHLQAERVARRTRAPPLCRQPQTR